jgi:copper chaperone CopZ
VVSSAISVEGGTATVEYDPAVVTVDSLVGAVNAAGHVHGEDEKYTATVAD